MDSTTTPSVSNPPVMPAPGSARPDPESLRALRRFHLGLDAGGDSAGFRPLFAPPAPHEAPAGGLDALLALVDEAATARFEPAWDAFTDERGALAEMLRAAQAAARAQGETPESVRGEVGPVSARFVDAGALSRVLGASPAGPAPAPERDAAVAGALRELEASLGPDAVPARHLVVLDDLAPRVGRRAGWTVTASSEPCDTAAARFDEAAARTAALLRDVRLARLETEGAYDPARHEPWLAALRWEMFSREELLLVPPVVAVVTADHAAGPGMVALSQLLRSRRPVQVVVLVDPGRDEDFAEGAVRFEAGYLGMSHREALVQQTSLVRPDHARYGFELGFAAAHTALHVVDPAADPARAEAAVASRALPLFHYDPELGRSWAKRLDFGDNPAPDADWVPASAPVKAERGAAETAAGDFTYADYVLLDPARAHEFRPVPDAWANDHVVPLAEALEAGDDDALRRVPFVWGVGDDGRAVRLAVTRRLLAAAADRLDFWRTLQELAGVRNEYVEAAETRVRAETRAEAQAELSRVRGEHEAALARLRETAADDLVRRLVAVLLDVDLGPPAPPVRGFPAAGSAEEMAAALLSLIDAESLDGTGA